MIDPTRLKDDLKKQVTALEKDLHDRLKKEPHFAAPLKAKYDEAFQSKRTASTFIAWAEQEITQAAVAWVLATVFIRFLEDNGLIPDPILSGPPERLRLAQDALSHHFMQHPGASERDYLLHHFSELRKYPALTELLGPHNSLHALHPSPDALKGLIAFWRQIDPASGAVRHDFTDEAMNTRFLGDLYQDLSEAARKTYALLQTPDFIEAFILDRTLTPALREFGLKTVRMIDPTCGSGHFMLGSFRRLFALWLKEVPTAREAAVNALKAVHGVDLNPFAVAITRFRLIIEACHACGVKRLADAPDFEINVATGDALLHGRRFRDFEGDNATEMTFDTEEVFRDELKHHYEVEDVEALHRILGQQYHAVVGNPPYITVKDRAVSELYRARYPSCHRKYSLSVPLMERFFDLAVKGDGTPQQPAGFVGQITSNSFMKREFGKKLIEEYLPRWDLTHVLDTAGAYIPGHGTPTVILFGKNQPPVSGTIRTVLGITGEPATPAEPALGLVWQSILRQIDDPGSVSEWMSAADSPRASKLREAPVEYRRRWSGRT
ncbi:MAG: BREX-2 system adenine-specific DNA-methyltransferase PglX [Verrucomicrobiaceae bacterium]|nr:BREX-2 system adenine-specific DNA-methyltransferase PglX [Verrucomicrobiaceae bacterium]